MWLFL
jgi:hypothetical protein